VRRWAPAGLTVLLLAACGLPEGVDGDLTGGWADPPEPVGFVPEGGTCHDSEFRPLGRMSAYRPVPCDDSYLRQTVHVGTFTGEVAERVTAPPAGSPELREAYRECDAAAADFLGADFRHGRMWLGVVRPTDPAWRGGARWFRCDVTVWQRHESRGLTERLTGSLRRALAERSELSLGCFAPEEDEAGEWIEAMNPVGCDEPHTAEFVGVWTVPEGVGFDLELEDDHLRAHRGCLELAADHVVVPEDDEFRFFMSTIVSAMDRDDWEAGDRGVRCYLYVWDREVSRSLRGAGPGWRESG
jgi:hypothetical protein